MFYQGSIYVFQKGVFIIYLLVNNVDDMVSLSS